MFVDGTKNVTVSVKDGKFSADLCDLGASVYNITVVYDGDGNHLSSNDSTNLTVHCLNGSFDVGVGDIVYGDGFIIDVANATGVNGILLNGTVDVTVDGKVYSFNVVDGVGSYEVSDILPVGKYVVNASLLVPNYNVMSSNTSFVVKKIDTVVSIGVGDIVYGDVAVVNGTVSDVNGNVVDGEVTLFVDGSSHCVRNVSHLTSVLSHLFKTFADFVESIFADVHFFEHLAQHSVFNV